MSAYIQLHCVSRMFLLVSVNSTPCHFLRVQKALRPHNSSALLICIGFKNDFMLAGVMNRQ